MSTATTVAAVVLEELCRAYFDERVWQRDLSVLVDAAKRSPAPLASLASVARTTATVWERPCPEVVLPLRAFASALDRADARASSPELLRDDPTGLGPQGGEL